MPERTTTTWSCSRCRRTEEVEGTSQPKDWTRVGFVVPPRASWNDRLTVLGDLCNGPLCGGLLRAFVNGKEDAEKARRAEFEAMMAKINEGDEVRDPAAP